MTRKDISYFQNLTDSTAIQSINQSIDAIIQPGDLISVHVTSLSKEASSFFNTLDDKGIEGPVSSYLVSAAGTIDIPLVGSVKVSGMSATGAKEIITSGLSKYLVEPSVRVRIRNFKVTLLGEVSRPGVYPIENAKITLIEALGLAGDLTIFGQRANVLIIREENGERKFLRIDLKDQGLFNSDYYYLKNNDIVYVEPGKGKIASADAVYRWLPIVLSGLTTLALFIRAGTTF
jgi:polysaccharide export outer membrane protein